MSKAHRLLARKPSTVGSSPKSRAAVSRSAMTAQTKKGLILPFNFLLGCSARELDNYILARMADIADLRRQIHELFDRLNDTSAQVIVAQVFRSLDRESLKHAIENEETTLEWANRMIRERQRNGEELIPLTPLEPGAAHLAAALRYQERNIEEGKCQSCPQPLDPRSHRYCTKHLEADRLRYTPKQQRLEPGMIAWLYGETPEKGRETHPRQKMRRVSKAGKELLERVAKELGMTVEHVRRVALGDVRSEVVLRHLYTAFEKLPLSQGFLAPPKML